MKSFITAICLLLCIVTFSQQCDKYYLMQSNKTVEMSFTKPNGKPNGKLLYKIADVDKNGSNYTASVSSEMYNEKGKVVSKAQSSVKCQDGLFAIDCRAFVPAESQGQGGPMEINVKDANMYLEYPATMQVGEVLKEGNFTMSNVDVKSGMKTTTDIQITERKVMGKENISSAAGSWDCYKISSNQRIKITISGLGIPFKMVTIEWFAPNFGVVKTESKYGTSLITAIK